jgi:hypothetical protein
MLISIIIFIVVLIISFSLITYFNIKRENNNKENKTSEVSLTTTSTELITTEEVITTTKETTTTTKIKETKTTTTKEKETTELTTELVNDIINPNSLGSWDLLIYNLINEERIRNGLNTLSVRSSLYNLTISAVDKWPSIHDEGLKEYLNTYNYYGYQSNILSSSKGYKEIASEVFKNTDVETNAYLNYIGLYTKKIDNKYYFIIMYE